MSKNGKNWALVTGASGGIGLEFAKQLAARGFNVICASRNLEKLKTICIDLENEYGISALPLKSDLSKAGAAGKLFSEALKAGEIAIVINNAGSAVFGLCENQNAEEIKAMLDLNITSLTLLCMSFAGYMKKRGSGYILNVGSMVAYWPEPYLASYAASKSYVLSFSAALRSELKGSGVSVTCLQPGFVRTSFDDNAKITSEKYLKFSSKNALTAAKVARTGLRLMFRKRLSGIPGVINNIAAFFNRMLSKRIQAAVIKSTISRLIDDK